jgi:hypothetical protein
LALIDENNFVEGLFGHGLGGTAKGATGYQSWRGYIMPPPQ